MVQSLLKRHERPSGEASGKYLEIMGRHASMQNKKDTEGIKVGYSGQEKQDA